MAAPSPSDDDDLVGYVARLETMNVDEDDDEDDDDDAVGGELADEMEPLDVESLNSDELMAEVERFLRDQPDG